MRRTKLLLIFSLLWPCLSQGTPYQFRTHQNEPTTTEIRMITPFTPQGVNAKLKIIKELKGTCWTNSISNSARPNTWRCRANNEIYDPCFKNTTRDHQSVICMKTPWDKGAVVLKLSTPLPTNTKSSHFNMRKALPWALELSNGKYCTYTTLANAELTSEDVSYRCDPGSYVIGNIDRLSKNWFVLYHGHDSLYMKQVRVKTAWF